MPVAPGGGHSTQLAAPDDTAPADEPVELPPVPRPVADDRPEAVPPPPEPTAAPVPAVVPVPVVVLPVGLVVVALVPLVGVAFEVVVAVVPVLVVGPVLVVTADPPVDGRTTALPLAGNPLRCDVLPTLLPVAVCAAAGMVPRASSNSAKPASRTMPGQVGPSGRAATARCRPHFAALLGFWRIRPVRKRSR